MTTQRKHPMLILLVEEARKRGINEEEILRAWDEMVRKYDFPIWVVPELIMRSNGEAELSPAVPVEALVEIHRIIPDFENIKGPTWVNGSKSR